MRKLGSVVDAQQFNRETLEAIFLITDEMFKNCGDRLLDGKIMATLFYEPSTRTRLSFEAAMKRLGGEVIGTENAKEFSSKAKGESLEDSIRVISSYCDVLVLRYHKEGGAKRAAEFSKKPVINAGDGKGQHPTQALLDIYTIRKCFGAISGLNIAMVGDLYNGRTVRSLCYLLAKHFPNNKIFLVSPVLTRMGNDIKEFLTQHQVKWSEHNNLDEIVCDVDVIYQTRVQKERFEDNMEVYEKVLKESEALTLTEDIVSRMHDRAIIMHPLPRVTEISYEVDNNPRAKYFEQAENGLFVRMALLKMILVGY